MEHAIELIQILTDFILHVDQHLNVLISSYGAWVYVILFALVFCETGLVVTPYLPGDSLLFAAGAFAGLGSLDLGELMLDLFLAAVLGDAANYWIARKLGDKLIANKRVPIKQAHVERTEEFYARHGAKTLVMARFVPIVRTFAPFMAGVGRMDYRRFTAFNVIGAIAWIGIFVLAGYFFGNNETVRKNFTLVVMGVIFVSVLPILFEVVRHRLQRAKAFR